MTGFGEPLLSSVRANLAAFTRRSAGADGSGAGATPAAVAVVLTGDDSGRACFVLTRRASRLRTHAGQWALPGGRVDDGEDATAAALRELHEELGVRLAPEAVLGLLDDYPTRSGYAITPVVVGAPDPMRMRPNPDEVAAVHLVPVDELDRPDSPRTLRIPESERPVLQVPIGDSVVHAPTAAVLYQLREVAIHGRPTRVHHFDQPVFAWR